MTPRSAPVSKRSSAAATRERFWTCARAEQKERLFGYKEQVWTAFGYTRSYLESMKSQSFWDAEFDKIPAIDQALLEARKF